MGYEEDRKRRAEEYEKQRQAIIGSYESPKLSGEILDDITLATDERTLTPGQKDSTGSRSERKKAREQERLQRIIERTKKKERTEYSYDGPSADGVLKFIMILGIMAMTVFWLLPATLNFMDAAKEVKVTPIGNGNSTMYHLTGVIDFIPTMMMIFVTIMMLQFIVKVMR